MGLGAKGVYEVLREIAEKRGNEKIEVIRAHKGDEFLRFVLVAALDPFRTYGIQKAPCAEGGSHEPLLSDFKERIGKLEARELTGAAAQEWVSDAIGGWIFEAGELLRFILTKDLRAGIGASTVNKAIPGLIPTFDCMLAHKYDEGRVEWPVSVEPKLDGVRVLSAVDTIRGSVQFFSRSGKSFTAFDHIKEPLLRIVGDWAAETDAKYFSWMLDSEIVSGSFNKTVGDVRRKDEAALDAELHLFDMLPLIAFSSEDKAGNVFYGSYIKRRGMLTSLLQFSRDNDPVKAVPSYVVSTPKELEWYYERFRSAGLEGVIVKDRGGLYHRRRNYAWMKIKAEESVDVPVVDAIEGTGKYEGMLGALVVDHKGVHVNVGTGFDDAQREHIWTAWNEGGVNGRLIEVQYHEETPDGSLRHPRFVRWRDDKAS